jgi:hypothetical protein
MSTEQTIDQGQVSVHVLRQPQEVSRRFKVDKTLAWRISRAVREEDAWQALEHLPSRSGINIFVNAMTAAGAPTELVDALWRAQADFERFVESSAGDRGTLDMIVSRPSRPSSHRKLESFRKGGFACNASLLGVRAKLHLGVRMMVPSAEAGKVDLGVAAGLLELFRLRTDTQWPVATIRNWGGFRDQPLDSGDGPLSIEPHPGEEPSPIIRSHCSPADLRLQATRDADGTARYMLAGGSVGITGAVNVVYGWMHLGTASTHEQHPGERGEHAVLLNTPVEALVMDFLVHRSLPFAFDLRADVYSMFPGSPLYPHPGSEHSRLPVPTEVLDLGYSLPDAPSEALPDYAQLVEKLASRMGTRIGDLRCFRYRLSYPPIPAMCVLSHPLLPG